MAWSRESRHKRGYGYTWTKLRETVLRLDNYLCQPCLREGRITPASEVHHIKPKAQGGGDELVNLMSTCHPCHLKADAEAQGRRIKPNIGLDGWPV